MTPTEFFEALCKERQWRTDMLRGRRVDADTVSRRRVIAKEMWAAGFTLIQIGAAMNKDHSSIKYMVDDEYRKRKVDKMREYMRGKSENNTRN